jgi:GT2 family glycosyltransferase
MADRPPFILAFAGDSSGCGFHRVMMPLASLVEAGVADGRIDLAIWPDEAGVACNPDVVVWQRQVEDAQIEAMARWRKLLPKALFVYELDDYLNDIPSASFHASFMPTDIKTRISRALVYCDRISTTTIPMSHWLETLAPLDCRIDVIPNALPVARLRERKARTTGKLRVGFAGGISHAGDLELLREAMTVIGDEVTWVFFGMAPEDPPIEIEFHEGVPATLYLDKMASLDLDLMLAPLADNPFNRCKSNLRLIEAAAIGAAIIAQDLMPYHVNSPPVFAYVDKDWTVPIQRFIASSRSDRQRSADLLRTWAGRHYTLERLLQARMDAWLPVANPPWRPNAVVVDKHEKQVVACADVVDTRTRLPFLTPVRMVPEGLEAACRTALTLGADVMWLRPATTFDEQGYERLKKLLGSSKTMASVVPLASDGANGFPQVEQWTSLPPAAVTIIARLAGEQSGERSLLINAPTGPVICLSARALAALGVPDVKGCDGNEEQALMEWGLRASMRNWKHAQALGAFAGSTAPPVQPTSNAALRIHARGLGEQLKNTSDEARFSPGARAQLEMCLLREQWGGPRPGAMGFANDYDAWSVLRQVQEGAHHPQSAPEGPVFLRAFGDGKDWQDDAYIIFIDSAIVLHRAEKAFATALAQKHKTKPLVLYGDHNSIIGGKAAPEFKPDFDPLLFMAQDYVTPICAVHASLLANVPANRTELFETVLNAYVTHGRKAFYHIPRVLGSMEIIGEPETMALETLERQLVIESFFKSELKVAASRHIIGCLTVTRAWKASFKEPPLVSIIVPTLGSGRLIQPCVATILQHTAYPNYEIIVVQNGTKYEEPELSETVLNDSHVRVVYYEEAFNWSKINNWAIRVHAKGDYIVTMNDDVCVGSKQWLDLMMGHAARPDVGAVGAKLIHPAGVVQHVGVVCHNGIAGHLHKGIPNGQAGHLGRALLAHEAVAVTGACMLFSRVAFDEINGFETSLSHNYNDTVFCVTLHKRGRVNIVETSAELLHPEASSRPESSTPEGRVRLLSDGARLAWLCPDPDPYWNPNMALAVDHDGLSIQGLNADMLAWTEFTPRENAQRILLINDRPGTEGCILEVLHNGDVPFLADLSGFTLRLIAPGPLNIAPWDIRDTIRLASDLAILGIDRIVLRSLVGLQGAAPPVEALRTINEASLAVPVDIKPIDFALMAPWLVEDGRTNDHKTFGYVDMAAWRTAYEKAITGEGGDA